MHVNHPLYMNDGVALDPARPETLVYVRRPGRPLELIAFMYRAPVAPTPTDNMLMRWHLHGGCVNESVPQPDGITVAHRGCGAREVLHYGSTAMMHVWMHESLSHAYGLEAPRGPVD